MTVDDVAYVAAEVATYLAVGVVGWRVHPLLGVGMVVGMAGWWGLLHAPRAALRLPTPVDVALRVVWFGIGLACALRLATGWGRSW